MNVGELNYGRFEYQINGIKLMISYSIYDSLYVMLMKLENISTDLILHVGIFQGMKYRETV